MLGLYIGFCVALTLAKLALTQTADTKLIENLRKAPRPCLPVAGMSRAVESQCKLNQFLFVSAYAAFCAKTWQKHTDRVEQGISWLVYRDGKNIQVRDKLETDTGCVRLLNDKIDDSWSYRYQCETKDVPNAKPSYYYFQADNPESKYWRRDTLTDPTARPYIAEPNKFFYIFDKSTLNRLGSFSTPNGYYLPHWYDLTSASITRGFTDDVYFTDKDTKEAPSAKISVSA